MLKHFLIVGALVLDFSNRVWIYPSVAQFGVLRVQIQLAGHLLLLGVDGAAYVDAYVAVAGLRRTGRRVLNRASGQGESCPYRTKSVNG